MWAAGGSYLDIYGMTYAKDTTELHIADRDLGRQRRFRQADVLWLEDVFLDSVAALSQCKHLKNPVSGQQIFAGLLLLGGIPDRPKTAVLSR